MGLTAALFGINGMSRVAVWGELSWAPSGRLILIGASATLC